MLKLISFWLYRKSIWIWPGSELFKINGNWINELYGLGFGRRPNKSKNLKAQTGIQCYPSRNEKDSIIVWQ